MFITCFVFFFFFLNLQVEIFYISGWFIFLIQKQGKMDQMSSDNINGLILAVSSSIFIGSSFIIKKKGLKKAGASGVRAGLYICHFCSWIQTSVLQYWLLMFFFFVDFIYNQVKEDMDTCMNHGGGLEWLRVSLISNVQKISVWIVLREI